MDDVFKELLQLALDEPKPRLFALIILCQGYLAAHDHADYKPVNISLTEEKEEQTNQKSWWLPVFGNIPDYEDTPIYLEVKRYCNGDDSFVNLQYAISDLFTQSKSGELSSKCVENVHVCICFAIHGGGLSGTLISGDTL